MKTYNMGTLNIEVYSGRDGCLRARVTLTDPTWEWKPYVPPPQLVGTTDARPFGAPLRETLQDAQELALKMSMDAIIEENRGKIV